MSPSPCQCRAGKSGNLGTGPGLSAQHDDVVSALVVFLVDGTSRAGLQSKKSAGLMWNVWISAGLSSVSFTLHLLDANKWTCYYITGQSSTRG